MAAALAGGAAALQARAQQAEENTLSGNKRNVLLIFTDDHGAHLECLGTRGLDTPNINALARNGVLFRNGFSTCASCSPSRMALLTGMYPHSNGGWRNVHSPGISAPPEDYTRQTRFREREPVGVHEDIPTLVEILNGAGYVTAITDKLHLSPIWKFPFQEMFESGKTPAQFRESAHDFLARNQEQPFFLQLNISETHRPFVRPHIKNWDVPPIDKDAINPAANLPDTPLMREDLAEYYKTIEVADAKVGIWLEELRKAGLAEDTLVIFTGDQGYCYQRAKATPYDEGIRVPFIVHMPGGKVGDVSEALVSHIDLMPTMLDWLGLPAPGTVQGTPLQPLLKGDAPQDWRRYVFAEHNAHGPGPREYYPARTVWDGRFHYIRNLMHETKWEGELEEIRDTGFQAEFSWVGPADAFPGGNWGNRAFEATVLAKEEYPVQYELLEKAFNRPAEELYDLHTDPGEIVNLAEDPCFQDKLAELREQVDAWMRETNDPGIALRETPRRE